MDLDRPRTTNPLGIWIDKDRMGGRPCLTGSRIPIGQFLAELASGRSVKEIAKDYEQTTVEVRAMLEDLGIYFNRSFTETDLSFLEFVRGFK